MSPKYLKTHDEFNPTVSTVEKIKEEVEDGSSYPAGLTDFFTTSVLTCVFLKGVVAMGSSKTSSMEVTTGLSRVEEHTYERRHPHRSAVYLQ